MHNKFLQQPGEVNDDDRNQSTTNVGAITLLIPFPVFKELIWYIIDINPFLLIFFSFKTECVKLILTDFYNV